MKPNTSARPVVVAQGQNDPTDANRRRRQVLVVEPDALTQWSLRMYLGKWFAVHSTNSVASARHVLLTHPVDVLVVSEELPPSALATLEQRAHSFNARVSIVRTVADPSKPCRPGRHVGYLEKPFELANLARLLGIPEDQLSPE